MKLQIKKSKLNKIILEEWVKLCEEIDHESVKTIVTYSSKLLKTIEEFERNSNSSMNNALSIELKQVKEKLEHMIENPSTYVDNKLKQVSLRKV